MSCLICFEKSKHNQNGCVQNDCRKNNCVCFNCYKSYIQGQVEDGNPNIKCPFCENGIQQNVCRQVLPTEFYNRFLQLERYNYVKNNDDIHMCRKCSLIVSIDKNVFNVECPNCLTHFCRECRYEHDPFVTCDEHNKTVQKTEDTFEQYVIQNGLIKCPNPNCGIICEKDNHCSFVKCSSCGKMFDFNQQLKKQHKNSHFNTY